MWFKTVLFAGVLWLTSAVAFGQQFSYYVVIGAFEIEDNAKNFVDQAHALNVPAVYSMNAQQTLYYVYVRNTVNKGDAYTTLKDMQHEGFRDAWIFKGVMTGYSSTPSEKTNTEIVSNPQENNSQPVTEIPIIEAETQPVLIAEEPKPEVAEETPKVKPAGKPFKFNLVSGTTGNPIKGLVRLQESDRATQFRGYNGNELVYIVPPSNKSGRW